MLVGECSALNSGERVSSHRDLAGSRPRRGLTSGHHCYTVTGDSSKGTVTVSPAGAFTYTPSAEAQHAASAVGATAADKQYTFAVTVDDGHGGTKVVDITAQVVPNNVKPTTTVTKSAPDAAGVVVGSLGATDADSDVLTYTVTTDPSKGAVTVSANGTFTYTPTAAARRRAALPTATAADKQDTFNITLKDGYGGVVVVTVVVSVT